MKNEKAIQKMNTDIASPKTMQEISELGRVFKASGFFPEIRNEAQAVVKILCGQELGISPMQAMNNIYVINTKEGANIQISSHLIAASIKQSPKYNYKLQENTDQQCVIEFFENGESQGEYTYTIKDAQQAGLANRFIWKSHTRDMLFNRCISGGYKKFCPDVIGMPVYTEGEFADDEDISRGEERQDVPQVVDADDILESGNRGMGISESQQANTDKKDTDTESKKPTTSNQQPKPTDRPYSIPILLDKYEQISKKNTEPASDDEILFATKSLNAGCQHHGPKKEAVMHFFTGKKSVEELTVGECLFFQKWIGHKPGKSAGWLDPEHPEAIQEIESVYETVLNQIENNEYPYADDLFGGGKK